MTDPTDKIRNTTTYRDTEANTSASAVVATLDTGNTEKIYLMNKGPDTVFFRTDGTTPTALAAGNGDQLISGASILIEDAKITSVKFICDTAKTATVFSRLFT